MNSLGNELHRYYRTICVDYRNKVEEHDKSWALRVLKLRHARKMWHLANLVTQCRLYARASQAASGRSELGVGPGGSVDWMGELVRPPLHRLLDSIQYLSAEQHISSLLQSYDNFLSSMASRELRSRLEQVPHQNRQASSEYLQMRANAERFEESCSQLVRRVLDVEPEYFVRFCVL